MTIQPRRVNQLPATSIWRTDILSVLWILTRFVLFIMCMVYGMYRLFCELQEETMQGMTLRPYGHPFGQMVISVFPYIVTFIVAMITFTLYIGAYHPVANESV